MSNQRETLGVSERALAYALSLTEYGKGENGGRDKCRAPLSPAASAQVANSQKSYRGGGTHSAGSSSPYSHSPHAHHVRRAPSAPATPERGTSRPGYTPNLTTVGPNLRSSPGNGNPNAAYLDGASFGTPPLSQQRQVLQPAAFSPHQFHSNPVKQRPPVYPTNGSGGKGAGAGALGELEKLSRSFTSNLDDMRQKADQQQILMVSEVIQDLSRREAEVHSLREQRERDVVEKAELSRQLHDAIDTITAMKRLFDSKLDEHVTNLAADHFKRAGEHGERALLSSQLDSVSDQLAKVSATRDHFERCLEIERNLRQESEAALRHAQQQQQQQEDEMKCLHNCIEDLQKQLEKHKECSQTMARSLASVLKERDNLMVQKSEIENSINAPSRSPQSLSNNTHDITGTNNLGVGVYTILQDDRLERERERQEEAAAERERKRREEDVWRAAEAKARSEALAVWERQKAASIQQAQRQLHSSTHTTVPPSSFYPPNSPSQNFAAPSQTSSFVHSGTPGSQRVASEGTQQAVQKYLVTHKMEPGSHGSPCLTSSALAQPLSMSSHHSGPSNSTPRVPGNGTQAHSTNATSPKRHFSNTSPSPFSARGGMNFGGVHGVLSQESFEVHL